jgi:transposase InsO family protein
MTRRVLPVRLMAAVLAFVAGEEMNVSAVCAEAGVSRKTFYKYVQRCRREGLAGFEERSRRPNSFPSATPAEVEDAVAVLRKRLSQAGHDHGASTIQWHLGRDDRFKGKVPSVITVHRILVRRGFVTPQPEKRPKSSWRRYEAPAPNEWWQMDAMDWFTLSGMGSVFNVLDDHSRVVCRSRAAAAATGEEAWTTFCQAAQGWGLPAGVLTDNGLCFSGKLRGYEVLFETRLREAGVRPFTGRPYHPQTTGKVERFQQTLKKWLLHQNLTRGYAADLADLQARLDEFCAYYNEQRPHQGIGRVTPLSRWLANPRSGPAERPLEHPPPPERVHVTTVSPQGVIEVTKISIAVGVEWAGTEVTVIVDAHHATVFSGDQLIRHLLVDWNRTYQPSGRRRGGPRRSRKLAS